MTLKMKYTNKATRIITLLNTDDPDFSSIAQQLGEGDYPTLNELVKRSPAHIATKAVICLGRLGSEKSLDGISFAAKSENPVLRLTAAQALGEIKNINQLPGAIQLVNELLTDVDIGVRKFALRTIQLSKISHLKEKIDQMRSQEPNEHVRKLSQDVLGKLEG
jgi:HEAT repeat protein